jgi:thiamine-phosphate pyrophosphorylase
MTVPRKPSINSACLRAIDANVNRGLEALRVVEDCLRFVLEDAHLSRKCKQLRHDLTGWASQFDPGQQASMRDARDDVGRHSQLDSEYHRPDTPSILRANCARAGQALRTLEEFSKTFDGSRAAAVEQLRYGVYELEKAALILESSRHRLRDTCLYVLTAAGDDEERFRSRIQALVAAGADAIQLRDPALADRKLLRYATILVQATRDDRVLSIVNDRCDVALAAGADGVHLGQEDLPVTQARRVCGAEMLLGVSIHNLAEARAAVLDGADYIGVGPTFPSGTKSFDRFTGTRLLKEVAAEIALPAFAIGGIDASNVRQVRSAGIHRVAVAGAVPQDPRRIATAVRELREGLSAGRSKKDHPDPDPSVVRESV